MKIGTLLRCNTSGDYAIVVAKQDDDSRYYCIDGYFTIRFMNYSHTATYTEEEINFFYEVINV